MSITSEGLSPASSPTDSGTLGPGTHPPKYGTLIPNRIFVGGIAANTNEVELKAFFCTYGSVRETKIIADRAGVSKGYGFVTFETEDDVKKILKESENIVFKERKLNIGPAIRKQSVYPKMYYPTQQVPNGAVLYHDAAVPYGGLAVYTNPDGSSYAASVQQQQPTTGFPPSAPGVYSVPQYAQYHQTSPAQPQWSQWRWTPQGSYVYSPVTPESMMYMNPHMYPMEISTDQSQGMVEGPPEGSMAPTSPKYHEMSVPATMNHSHQANLMRKPTSLPPPLPMQTPVSGQASMSLPRPMVQPYTPPAQPAVIYTPDHHVPVTWVPVSEKLNKQRLVAKTVNGVKVLVEELDTSHHVRHTANTPPTSTVSTVAQHPCEK